MPSRARRISGAPEVQLLQRCAAREGAGQRNGAGVADGVIPASPMKLETERSGCRELDEGVTEVAWGSGERMGGGSEAS